MGGIILGALAGAGAQMVDLADKSITQDHALERERVSSDLATQRAQALELFKEGRVDALRGQMVARVGAAAEKIADDKMAPKVAQEQAGIVDQASWTPEQQAAVDQSNQMDRSGIIAKAKTDGSAAIATGDIDPKDAATLNNKSEALLYKTLYEQSKEEGRNNRADARNEAMLDAADKRAEVAMRGQDMRLKAMLEHFSKAGAGNPTKEALSFISEQRKAITSEEAQTRALFKAELDNPGKSANIPKIKESYQAKLDALSKQRRMLDGDFNKLRTKVGLDPVAADDADTDAEPSPAPAPGAPAPARPPLSSFQK